MQDQPEKRPDDVTIKLHESASVPTAKGTLAAPPADQPASGPGTGPRAICRGHTGKQTREARLSVTVKPADAPAEPPAEPPGQPEPADPPETIEHSAARTNPDRVPEEEVAATPARPRPLQSPPGILLLPGATPAGRSEQLERIAQQADRQIRRGFELAGRGAYFAARSQFIRALRLSAQGLDTERQTTLHSRSLAAGLTALREAEDFIPTGSRLEADLDVPGIIERHCTPVLKDAHTESLTALSALKCYFTFAQEQLAAAAGNEVAGSMALHALGKLHGVLARHNADSIRAGESKAVAFYQAALLAYPKNSMAANDLGVLLARCGNCREAEAALRYSLSICPQSTTWHNLAVVRRQLGQAALARQADQYSQSARRVEIARRKALPNPSHQPVRWVDPRAFSQFRINTPAVPPPGFTRARPTNAVEPSQPANLPRAPSLPRAHRLPRAPSLPRAHRAAQMPTKRWSPWNMQEQRR